MTATGSDIPVRAFLVGCPRSRTTVAQTVISQACGLVTMSTNWWLEAGATRLLNGPEGESREVTRPFAIDRVAGGLRDAVGIILPAGFEVGEALDRLAVESGAAGWLDKTPLHVLVVAEIESDVTGARFVHLVRDPEAVVASFVRRAANHPDMRGARWQAVQGNCEAIWRDCVRATLAVHGRANHLVVDSEAFVASPEAEAQQVAAFLGIAYRRREDSQRQAAARALTPSPKPWKQDAAGLVRRIAHERVALAPLDAATIAVWHEAREVFGIPSNDPAEGVSG